MAEQVVELPASGKRDSLLPDVELYLLLEAIVRYSGHDYRDYAPATLKRRVSERMRAERVKSISGLQEVLLHDEGALERFVAAMSGGTATIFRAPEFFQTFRIMVVPLFRTYPMVRLWIPNCGAGADVYSIAALLADEHLLDRATIYATDESLTAINQANERTYAVPSRHELDQLYARTGTKSPFSKIGKCSGESAVFDEKLAKLIIFAQHSLSTSGSLNEFHAIVARGVLPQFNMTLQFRVHGLFLESLARLGFLCLGSNESLKLTPYERVFRRVSESEAIYRRVR